MRALIVPACLLLAACQTAQPMAWQRIDGLRINDEPARQQAFHAARGRCLAMAMTIQPVQPAPPPFVVGPGSSAYASGYQSASVQGAYGQTRRAQESIMASCMMGEGYQYGPVPSGMMPR